MTTHTPIRRATKFHGECHNARHYAGHRKGCTCGQIVQCDLNTTDPELFVAHVKEHDRFGTYDTNSPFKTPSWVLNAAKPWKASRTSKLFYPKPFEVGATVQWIDGVTNTVRTGQVWSGHPAPRTKWVVAEDNGRGYAVAVRESELVDTWLSVARARRDRGLRSNQAHDRADAEYWAKAVEDIERQLDAEDPSAYETLSEAMS